MISQIELGGIVLEVVKKDIKNIHLSVYPPSGRVRVSAPRQMKTESIRMFVIAKLGWVRKQQKKMQGQVRETKREYLNHESHYVWGKRYLLKLVEAEAVPRIELQHSKLLLQIRPASAVATRKEVLASWYRQLIREAVPQLIEKWEPRMKVKVRRLFVQQMKTRWGTCNTRACTIRLNTELAKKPKGCLEYVVVHEMVHLLEPSHNPRFFQLMDQFMPQWRHMRDLLNSLPAKNERWSY